MNKKIKFYNRYYSIYRYKTTSIAPTMEYYDTRILIPKTENFRMHLENIRRLLEIEFGGVFKIIFMDEKARYIDTDIPLAIFEGYNVFKDDFTPEENEKIDKFLTYHFTGEKPIVSLW